MKGLDVIQNFLLGVALFVVGVAIGACLLQGWLDGAKRLHRSYDAIIAKTDKAPTELRQNWLALRAALHVIGGSILAIAIIACSAIIWDAFCDVLLPAQSFGELSVILGMFLFGLIRWAGSGLE